MEYKLFFYQSAGRPCPFPWTISGAKESAIPHIVYVLSPANFFPNLKSTSYNANNKINLSIHNLMTNILALICFCYMCIFVLRLSSAAEARVYSETTSLIVQVELRSGYILPSLDHNLQSTSWTYKVYLVWF